MDAALQTTLLILYFIGQPSADPKGMSKDLLEEKTNWTLQSTSQIETRSPDACRAIGNQLISRMERVNTMTVRAYCLCADATGAICKGTEEMSQDRDRNKNVQTQAKAVVEALGRSPRGVPHN